MKTLNVIDLFCGVGGLSYGFANNASFRIVAANEILPDIATAYSLNHPSVKMYNQDVKFFGAAAIRNDLGADPSDIDIIVGGPPCQAYSTVGKRLIDDPRGALFQEYYRILKEFQPVFFLYENVKGLLSMKGGELFDTILGLFESLGYTVQFKLLDAADYGVPQHRERVIIVGTLLKKEFSFPVPTHGAPGMSQDLFGVERQPYLTLKDAISDLPLINSGEKAVHYSSEPQNEFQRRMRIDAPNKISDHDAPKNGLNLIRIMEFLPEGGSPVDLPDHLKPSSGFKNTYSRLWWNKPCTTITRNLSTPSSSRCIHPKAPRPLTTREGARIQCFPDKYVFFGSRTSKNLQVGNAVPTLLSEALAKSILECFISNGY